MNTLDLVMPSKAKQSPMVEPCDSVLDDVKTIRRMIRGLLLAVFLLLGVGLVAVYSAAINLPTRAEGYFTSAPLIAQAARVLVCVVLLFAVARIPVDWLKRNSVLCLGLAVLLLAAVWIPGLGVKIFGARRWIEIAGVSFQPSELARLCFLIYLAGFLARFDSDQPLTLKDILPAIVALALVVTLVLSEPDLGTTVIVVGVSFALFVIAGVRPYRLATMGVFLVGAIAYYARGLDYVSRRFESFLDPPRESQVWHSIQAIGSGGMFGRGLGAGLQKLHFVPQSTSDFIVAVIGEEGGFFALTCVIALYASVIICGLRLLLMMRDRFAQLLSVGILLFISMGAVVNLAVATAIAPAKGLPLPFISAGGSAMMVGGLAIGLLLALSRHEILSRVADSQQQVSH